MNTFDELQDEKILRAERLYEILKKFPILRMQDNTEFIAKFVDALPDHLEYILKRIKAQMSQCHKDSNCIGLLSNELVEIEKAQKHVELVKAKVIKDVNDVLIASILKDTILPRDKVFFKRLQDAELRAA